MCIYIYILYIATRTHGLFNGNDIDLCCAVHVNKV